MRYRYLFLLYSLFTVHYLCAQHATAFADDPNSGQREHPIDISRMHLKVEFIPEQGVVKGMVAHYFHPIRDRVDSIFFDAPGIKIEDVSLNGQFAKFTTNDLGVTVFASKPLVRNQTCDVVFTYSCKPRKGIYFIGWNDSTKKCRRQIWTQGQGVDNRYWIPSYDEENDKLITETTITFDSKYKVLSNGTKLSEKDNGNGTKTWDYTMTHPHASYLLMLGIGDYAIKSSKSKSGVPMNFYYYPDMPDREEPTYRYSEAMMDFLEAETGTPYPWESYSQIPVQDFMYGAMENTTATIFGDFFMVDNRAYLDRNYVAVNAHEMTHQWFGDYVTGTSSKSSWLQESFATYYSKLFMRTILGDDQYEWNRRGEQTAALNATKSDKYPIASTHAGGSRVYQKGSATLDMLRYVVGDDNFKTAIRYYLKNHAYSNVETNDFYRAFTDTLGMNLDWFFNEWIYRGGEPEYTVSYDDVILKNNGEEYTNINISQTQPPDELTGIFKMPINIQVCYKDGTSDIQQFMIDKQSHNFRINNPAKQKIDFVLFDPGSMIIKNVVFNKSLDVLKAQALRAPHMIDRYDAVVAMKSFMVDEKIDVLIEVFGKEKFHAIKTEILSQLPLDFSNTKILNLHVSAMRDSDAAVRLSAVQFTQNIDMLTYGPIFTLQTDSSYAVVEAALDRMCILYKDDINNSLERTKDVYGIGYNVRVKWLEFSAIAHPDIYIPKLEELCTNSYEFRTRVNAMNALQRLDSFSDNLCASILNAAFSSNSRLSGPALTVLDYFFQQDKWKSFIHYKSIETAKEDWQKKILEKYMKY